jgi:hypothetical protein
MDTTSPARPRLVLRDFPLAVRLTLALFLISTGLGYVSALVQLHFQHAQAGSALPTREDAVRIFHGQAGPQASRVQILLDVDDRGPFSGSGQMSAAFTRKSEGWSKAVKARARQLARERGTDPEAQAEAAEAELRQPRDGERLAVLAWVADGARKADYDKDRFVLPPDLADHPVTDEYLAAGSNDNKDEPRAVKIKTILADRCVRCHNAESPEDAKAGEFPLDTYDRLRPYATAEGSSAMSLTKLAQTTHVHLLGFSMLYGLTGLILAFSSYPAPLRCLLCPLPLLAQVVDISFWWLARLPDPYGPDFAGLIPISGAVVAVGLLAHVLLGLWDLFNARGKVVLAVLLIGVLGGVAALEGSRAYVQNYLQQEKAGAGAGK